MFSGVVGGLFLLTIFHYFSPSEGTEAESALYTIPPSTATVIYFTFAVSTAFGVLTLALLKPFSLRRPNVVSSEALELSTVTAPVKVVSNRKPPSTFEVLKLTMVLATERRILFLYPLFINSGLIVGFATAIYPTTIISTLQLPIPSRVLLALNGIVHGLTSGATSCVLSTALQYQDSPIVQRLLADRRKLFVVGNAISLAALGLILLNLPWEAPLGRTHADGWLGPPSVTLALVCSFMTGMADSILSSTGLSHMNVYYRDEESERVYTLSSGILVSCTGSSMGSAASPMWFSVTCHRDHVLLQCGARAAVARVDPVHWGCCELRGNHSGRELPAETHSSLTVLTSHDCVPYSHDLCMCHGGVE